MPDSSRCFPSQACCFLRSRPTWATAISQLARYRTLLLTSHARDNGGSMQKCTASVASCFFTRRLVADKRQLNLPFKMHLPCLANNTLRLSSFAPRYSLPAFGENRASTL